MNKLKTIDENKLKIQCKICNKYFHQLNQQHFNQHGTSKERYCRNFQINKFDLTSEYMKNKLRISTSLYMNSLSEEKKILRSKLISKNTKIAMKKYIGKNNPAKRPEIRKKISKNTLGKKHKTFVSDRKGKTFEEVVGKEKAKEWKRKMIVSSSKSKKYKQYQYKGISFRSSWEVALVKWFDEEKIKWEYEKYTFDVGSSTYTPDFWLEEEKTFIEVKGYFYPSSIGKTALFAAFCYQLGYDFLLMTDYGNHGVNFIYPWQSLEIMKKIKMI